MKSQKIKAWRGYNLVIIADQATGIPLVWTLIDAAEDEAAAIVPLLSRLYRLWPDCPAKVIAGDSAWDENEWCRLCEVDYGIHPIFRLHPSYRKKGGRLLAHGAHRGDITGLTGEGQLMCSHRRKIPYETAVCPSRAGLRPGQSSDENAFRIRGRCLHGPTLSRPGLKLKEDWSALTYYPHYKDGDPARHAFREAMLVRLNGLSGIHNALKAGFLLGEAGSSRTRILSADVVEAIFSLALLSMTALVLADQRNENGIRHTLAARPVGAVGTATAPASMPAPAAAPVAVASPAPTKTIHGRVAVARRASGPVIRRRPPQIGQDRHTSR